MNLHFDPFPMLQSERLVYREILDTDVEEIFSLRSDIEIMRFIPRPLAVNLSDAKENIWNMRDTMAKKGGINWGICKKDDRTIIGVIGIYRIEPQNFRGEIGYLLSKEAHNQGYISEAIKVILDYAFNTAGFNSIVAILDPENLPSGRVLVKNGFRKEAHLVQNEFWNGKFLDSFIFGILASEFNQQL